MRRRPGIQGLQRGAEARDHYKVLGEHVQQTKLEVMRAQMATFKKSLEEFALKHREEVRTDPVFRAQFHTMCANVGVDPLASNKGMWAKLLNIGDFYYELGVQVVEACLAMRPYNGGLMELSTLRRLVQRRRGGAAEPITEDDLVRAIGKLGALGGGYALVAVGGQRLVRSVPGDLSTDTNKLLELAQGKGYLSEAEAARLSGWAQPRPAEALAALLRDGLALVDDGAPDGQRLYWFPCIDAAQSSAV